MKPERGAYDEQAKVWNDVAGQAWVGMQPVLDQMLQPHEEALVKAVADNCPEGQVLDVGCGTGTTTLAVAKQLGANVSCTGIDVSEAMIAAARSRAEKENLTVPFIQADAQRYTFQPSQFDMIISRMGVMFFDDPVEAFANLHRAVREGAGLNILVWRGPEENPYMTTAESAASPLLPNLPQRDAEGPGQFAFADQDRVRQILQESGWSEIDFTPADFTCCFPQADLDRFVTKLGPVGRALADAEEPMRQKVLEAVRPVMSEFVVDGEVRFVAAMWSIYARA